jgi:predicted nucleotidyltransferase
MRGVHGSSVSIARAAEIEAIIDAVTLWASGRPDVVGLLLVGSCARGAARPSSDVDFVLLSTRPYSAWDSDPAIGELTRTRSWGPITERRFVTSSGLEVELNVGTPDWAAVTPVDPGTLRVVNDGARVLHDPAGLLTVLLDACRGAAP